MDVFTPTPAWAISNLNRHSAGQQVRLVIVEGGGDDETFRSCLHKAFPSGFISRKTRRIPKRFEIRQESTTTPDGSKILTATNPISFELGAAIDGLSSMFLDQLYSAGLINETTPSELAWPLAIREQAARGFFGLQLQQHETNGCRVSIIDGFVYATTLLLEQLQNVENSTINNNKTTKNPTSEQQTSKKVTRRNGDKSEKWLRFLVESYRSELLEEARNRGITLADSKKRGVTFTDGDVDYYLATLVFCKSAKELSGMVADLPPTNGEKPPQRLTIKAARNILYREWEPYREQRNKKLIVGVNSIEEALDSGLSERSNRSSYVPAKTPAESLEDLETARLDKEADEFMKRTPKA